MNAANEITAVAASVGTTWVTSAYDAAGNMTTMPKPAALSSSYTATYDAWNRLIKLLDASTSQTVQQNQYDGRNFRTTILSYTSGILSETRHSYFTDDWRCAEERVGTATTADRQFVWGNRYIDDLILRDSGSQRVYALQDANWNVTAIVDTSGVSQERYSYSSYGTPTILTGSFGARSASSFSWETLFGGYRYDGGTQFFMVRNRVFHPSLGNWIQRDPLGYMDGLNFYAGWFVPHSTDPFGLGPTDACHMDGGGGGGGPPIPLGPLKGALKAGMRRGSKPNLPSTRPPYLTKGDLGGLPKTGRIDPRRIRHSQDSVGNTLKDGKGTKDTIDGLANKLRNREVDPASVDPIRIVEKDGLVYTLDNRRLTAFQEAGVDIPFIKLDRIPPGEMFNFTTKNEGTSVRIRGRGNEMIP